MTVTPTFPLRRLLRPTLPARLGVLGAVLAASLGSMPLAQAALRGNAALSEEGAALPRASQIWQPLADQGNSFAQNSLGYLYESGQGIPQNYGQAAIWYRRAAEQGDAMAQMNLGALYEDGLGVAQDFHEAANWYRQAAEQGLPLAQVMLGNLYEAGQGLPADAAEAARWYRRAAEQSDPTGLYYLGTLYESGQGVARDRTLALALYTLAAEGRCDDAARRAEVLAQRLPTQAVDQGRALAASWQLGAPLPEHGDAP